MNDTTKQTIKSFEDLPRPQRSITELVAKAQQRQDESKAIAANAIVGENLTDEDRAYLESEAKHGATQAERDEMAQALHDLEEAREMTFTDPIVRAAFFRARMAALAAEESPIPEVVLATMFSMQATRMRTKQGIKDAAPILALWKTWRDAQRHDKHPIVQPASQRKHARKGNGEFFAARGQNFLVPVSVLDREAFGQLKGLLKRMPAVLAAWLASNKTGVRQAAWFALHFLPGAQMLDTVWFGRMFAEQDGIIRRHDTGVIKTPNPNGKSYLRFELSPNEILVAEESEESRAVIDALKVLAGA